MPSAARTARAILVLLLLAIPLTANAQTGQPPPAPPATLRDAIGVFAREKTLAEEGAALLKTYGQDDVAVYARGIRLYAEARAEFDALIERIKHDLDEGRPPAESADLKAALDEAAAERVAFTSYVDDVVLADRKGTKVAYDVIFRTVAELLPGLAEAALKIWEAWDGERDERRDAIKEQLDAQRWRAFSAIEAIG